MHSFLFEADEFVQYKVLLMIIFRKISVLTVVLKYMYRGSIAILLYPCLVVVKYNVSLCV